MSKKESLYVGQKVWLETTGRFGYNAKVEEKPEELIVLEANKTSAYIWYNDQSKVRFKVNQKTHETKYPVPDGQSYRLWLSLEDYESYIVYRDELIELKQKMKNEIDRLPLCMLKQLNQSLINLVE